MSVKDVEAGGGEGVLRGRGELVQGLCESLVDREVPERALFWAPS